MTQPRFPPPCCSEPIDTDTDVLRRLDEVGDRANEKGWGQGEEIIIDETIQKGDRERRWKEVVARQEESRM